MATYVTRTPLIAKQQPYVCPMTLSHEACSYKPTGSCRYVMNTDIQTVIGAADSRICLSNSLAIAGAKNAVSGRKFNIKTRFWALGMQLITNNAATHIRHGGSIPRHPRPCTIARVQAGSNSSRTVAVAISCRVSHRSAGLSTSHVAAQPVGSEACVFVPLPLPLPCPCIPAGVTGQFTGQLVKMNE